MVRPLLPHASAARDEGTALSASSTRTCPVKDPAASRYNDQEGQSNRKLFYGLLSRRLVSSRNADVRLTP